MPTTKEQTEVCGKYAKIIIELDAVSHFPGVGRCQPADETARDKQAQHAGR